jgi:hypothetical protein
MVVSDGSKPQTFVRQTRTVGNKAVNPEIPGSDAITLPARSSTVTDGKDSDTRTDGVRVLGLIVVIVSMAATIFILISEGLEAAAAVAAVVTIPLFILSIQLDSGRGQRVAVMTALVGILALIATLVGVRPSEHESQTGPTVTPPTTPTSPTSPTPPPEPPTTPPAPPTTTKPPPPPPDPHWEAVWKDDFQLELLSGIELDTVPPLLARGFGDLLYDDSHALSPVLVPYGKVAIPKSNSRPDAKACQKAVQNFGRNEPFEPRSGQYLCVGTGEGRLARLEVTDAQYEYVQFNAIVWELKQ